MANYTKGWRKKLDEVHDRIMDGYRRGVCNKNGESVKVGGVYIGKARNLGSCARHLCNRCGQWYYNNHVCIGEQK